MPSDLDYMAMALGSNPGQFSPARQAEIRKMIDEEGEQERAMVKRLRENNNDEKVDNGNGL